MSASLNSGMYLCKKVFMKIFSLLLLLFISLSCSRSTDKIIGKWKLEEIDYSQYYSEVSEDVKLFFKEKVEIELERIKGKTFFDLKEDGQLNIEMPDPSGNLLKTQGKWSINATEDSLFFDLNGKESYKIIKLNESTLFLSTDETPKRILQLSKVK